MNPQKLFLLLLGLVTLTGTLEAQVREEMMLRRGRDVVRPDELVSFKSDVTLGAAFTALSEMSKKFAGKPILDPNRANQERPIGVNIESMDWRSAFELILRTNNLWYTEQPDFFQVIPLGAQPGMVGTTATGAPVVDTTEILANARQILISAIFLEIDRARLRESGINFNIFRGRDLNLGVEFFGAERVGSDIFGITVDPTSPRLAVDINAAIRLFESNLIGEVIARPQVTVRSGLMGRVQIGTDFSVKQRDIAGNVTDVFFSTGTILEVIPRHYQYGKLDFVDLQLKVERSTPVPGTVSSIIHKTTVENRLTLLNSEEAYAGGLYSNEEVTQREGIPLLKDLPWWFFGLRYIFGYDAVRVTQKELIVLIKAELVPTLEERVTQQTRDALQERLRDNRQDVERRRQRQDQ